jgi:hypothetical protein
MSLDIGSVAAGVAGGGLNPLQGLQELGQVLGMFQKLVGQAKSGNLNPNDLSNLLQTAQSGGLPGTNASSQPVPYSSTSTAPQGELSGSTGLSSQIQSEWTNQLNNIANIGNQINSLEQQAQQLMSSPNPADQAKGQMMMQQAQQMFNALSQFMKSMSDMAEKAIQNSNSQ